MYPFEVTDRQRYKGVLDLKFDHSNPKGFSSYERLVVKSYYTTTDTEALSECDNPQPERSISYFVFRKRNTI